MKVGEKVEVRIGEHQVAYAEAKEVPGDGTVVLIIPATRVVMGLKTSLTDLPEGPAPAKEVIIDSAERSSAVVEGETPNVTDASTSETTAPVVDATEHVTTPSEAASGGEVSPSSETPSSEAFSDTPASDAT